MLRKQLTHNLPYSEFVEITLIYYKKYTLYYI